MMEQLFLFLNNPAHRQYNKLLQTNSYRSMMMPWVTPAERVKALLYNIATTQSQPRIDQLATTFQRLHNHWNELLPVTNVEQLANFAAVLQGGMPAEGLPYVRLFRNLSAAPGFGPKTAALFVKSLIDIHTWDETNNLIFLEQYIPPQDNDCTYAPIDIVIWFIFGNLELGLNPFPINASAAFHPLNENIRTHHAIAQECPHDAIRVWDDLWFWGSFSQKTILLNEVNTGRKRKVRQMMLNQNKFMCNPAAPHHLWPEIAPLLQAFIALLQGPAPAEAP